jgi:hypothetical protein
MNENTIITKKTRITLGVMITVCAILASSIIGYFKARDNIMAEADLKYATKTEIKILGKKIDTLVEVVLTDKGYKPSDIRLFLTDPNTL